MEINKFKNFAKNNVLTTTEVAEFLKVTRQRVNALVKSNELTPFKQTGQISLFFRADVEKYMQSRKRGPYIKSRDFFTPKFFDNSGTTRKSLKYFDDNKDMLSEISQIFIYFDELDAVGDNFFIPSDNVYGDFYDLHIPHLVLKDVNDEELWLGGCNCGYVGEGPRGTEKILKYYNIPSNLINYIFENRVVKYAKNDDGEFEVFAHNSLCDPFSLRNGDSANLYLYKNNLVLIQDSKYYYSDSNATLDRFNAFIPNPVEVSIIPTYEEAASLGFVFPEKYDEQAYRLIISDSTGRQLWLDPSFDEDEPISTQSEICSLLDKCGFSIPDDRELMQNQNPLAKIMLSWLKKKPRKVPLTALHLRK